MDMLDARVWYHWIAIQRAPYHNYAASPSADINVLEKRRKFS